MPVYRQTNTFPSSFLGLQDTFQLLYHRPIWQAPRASNNKILQTDPNHWSSTIKILRLTRNSDVWNATDLKPQSNGKRKGMTLHCVSEMHQVKEHERADPTRELCIGIRILNWMGLAYDVSILSIDIFPLTAYSECIFTTESDSTSRTEILTHVFILLESWTTTIELLCTCKCKSAQ